MPPPLTLSRLERSIRPGVRRAVLGLMIVALAVLSVFPRKYVARTKIMAPQSTGAGLGQLLTQLGGLSGLAPLLGTRQPVEIYTLLARSFDVRMDVVRRLDMQRLFEVETPEEAVLELDRRIDVHTLRGGVLEIEAMGRDPALALSIATTYGTVFRDRLSKVAKDEVELKRGVMNDQLMRATTRLTEAEEALRNYRTTHHVASPEAQLGTTVAMLANLRGRLQAKEIELATLRRFATDDNFEVKRVVSEIQGLRAQIDKAETDSVKNDPFGFQAFTEKSNDYLRLYRELRFAEALYEIYSRYVEAVNVEELSANIKVQQIESPYLDPKLAFNNAALGLLIFVIFLAAALEYRAIRARETAAR